MAMFNNLCETFPDENCVLTNRELLAEVRGKKTTYVCFIVYSVNPGMHRSGTYTVM